MWPRIAELRALTYTSRGKVTSHPPPVAITLLLEREHRLVGVAESEVEGLGREVTDDVGRVTTPQRNHTLVLGGTAEALHDTIVLAVETAGLQHLILREHSGQYQVEMYDGDLAEGISLERAEELRSMPLGTKRT